MVRHGESKVDWAPSVVSDRVKTRSGEGVYERPEARSGRISTLRANIDNSKERDRLTGGPYSTLGSNECKLAIFESVWIRVIDVVG
jgi:hypothetical protein